MPLVGIGECDSREGLYCYSKTKIFFCAISDSFSIFLSEMAFLIHFWRAYRALKRLTLLPFVYVSVCSFFY